MLKVIYGMLNVNEESLGDSMILNTANIYKKTVFRT